MSEYKPGSHKFALRRLKQTTTLIKRGKASCLGPPKLLGGVEIHVVSIVRNTLHPGHHHLLQQPVEEKECKATVSTHPKYSQDLHQNYANYASVSKERGISVDYTAEMPE